MSNLTDSELDKITKELREWGDNVYLPHLTRRCLNEAAAAIDTLRAQVNEAVTRLLRSEGLLAAREDENATLTTQLAEMRRERDHLYELNEMGKQIISENALHTVVANARTEKLWSLVVDLINEHMDEPLPAELHGYVDDDGVVRCDVCRRYHELRLERDALAATKEK